ncbi:NAD(P)/FAD-dependent oxidoreductase [Paenibacillus hexagrammi]|uniref:NAD(P)/FAD-dependent oxidoreductase n=1 Tax=Paenibacillus hexagrammi TaxID=2908839 RepID=A0ABY3SU50_9BACL|nr:NAD(P)/FAD-dependent oxidoreductase [Paenibacillus sp. YPD9-1]UJF36511.1 NAD(P)/FAD-dependent oxidoreductase [Paenibacillus sp. YPD9-1]
MVVDCAILGGGPAGLNAALVLGRSRRRVILFDNNQPRNAVTGVSHGFITRDGVTPQEFRQLAHQDLAKYPNIELRQAAVTDIVKAAEGTFRITTENGEQYEAKTVLLATGLKNILPAVEGIEDFYGKSLFSCPYCDGWEHQDQPLILISENPYIFHTTKVLYNWSKDIIVASNGHSYLTDEQKAVLQAKQIPYYEQKIISLAGQDGKLERVIFEDGTEIERAGGVAAAGWRQALPFGELLGCELTDFGGIKTDGFGRTNVKGVYAAGDAALVEPAQLVIAAADGSKAAIGINSDMLLAEFG